MLHTWHEHKCGAQLKTHAHEKDTDSKNTNNRRGHKQLKAQTKKDTHTHSKLTFFLHLSFSFCSWCALFFLSLALQCYASGECAGACIGMITHGCGPPVQSRQAHGESRAHPWPGPTSQPHEACTHAQDSSLALPSHITTI